MPSIEANAPFVTQINHIKVAPENQAELVRLMTISLQEVIPKQPGFVSATLHQSRDGHHVVNYVQWESTEGLDALHANPEFLAHLAQYRHLILEAGPTVYDIVSMVP